MASTAGTGPDWRRPSSATIVIVIVIVIAVSGFGTGADIGRSEAAGFSHHLLKPVDQTRSTSLSVGRWDSQPSERAHPELRRRRP